jgi:uncharacterized repeat protein (TIGR01451 family)
VPYGSTRTLYVRAWVKAGTAGTPVNAVAGLTYARPYDTNAYNNVDTVLVTPAAGDLQVTKSELYGRTSRPAGAADSVIYRIVVQNLTAGRATNVVIHDTVPASMTFASYQATRGSFTVTGGVGVWTLDTIRGSAAPDTLLIRATYPAQSVGTYITNRVRIMSMDQTDGGAGNNTAQYVVSFTPAEDLNEEEQQTQETLHMASAVVPWAARPTAADEAGWAWRSGSPAAFSERRWTPSQRGAAPH